MASTTSDSLPSSPSLPTTAAALDGAADQEFSSHHHHHHQHSLFLPSSSSSPGSGSLYLDSFHQHHGLLPTSSTAMSSPSPPPPPVPPLPPAPAPSKPAKKRPRASRRPPTTVLTTDTSNFRAMVQEFTGIPSPPFGAGAGVGVGLGGPAASLRTRFDHIFPPPSSLRVAAAGGADSLPPYLLRPFAHKLPTAAAAPAFPPFAATTSSPSTSSTPSSSNIGVANANAATGTAAAPSPSNSNPAAAAADAFQQLTSSALLRLQDPASSYLSFQNLLDSQPSSQSIFGAAGGFAAQASRPHDPSDYLAGAGGGGGGLAHGAFLGGSEALQLHHSRGDVHGHGSDELSGVVAAGASGGSCKLNYSQSQSLPGAAASSSGAGSAEKPPDGGGAPGRPGRGEGLDPWICTSE